MKTFEGASPVDEYPVPDSAKCFFILKKSPRARYGVGKSGWQEKVKVAGGSLLPTPGRPQASHTRGYAMRSGGKAKTKTKNPPSPE